MRRGRRPKYLKPTKITTCVEEERQRRGLMRSADTTRCSVGGNLDTSKDNAITHIYVVEKALVGSMNRNTHLPALARKQQFFGQTYRRVKFDTNNRQ